MESVKHYRHRVVLLLLSQAEFESRMAAYRQEVSVMGEHSCQAGFVGELLECGREAAERLAGRPHCDFLLTFPPSRLRAVVRVVREFGVDAAGMRAQCLMLRCSPELARSRLRRAADLGVLTPRRAPCLLTNSDRHVARSLARWRADKEALGDWDSERQLLMHRLRCSERQLAEVLARKPRVAAMRAAKLRRCLDVLQGEVGLSAAAIRQHADLLHFSQRRLASRWALLQPLRLPEAELVRDLLLTQRKFAAKYGLTGG